MKIFTREHLIANIVIILLLLITSISSYNPASYNSIGESIYLQEPGTVVGFILGEIIIFFILFLVYYYIRKLVLKLVIRVKRGSSDTKHNKKNTVSKKEVSKWLIVVAILLVAFFVVTDYIDNKKQTSDDVAGVSKAAGTTLVTVIAWVIGCGCGFKNSKWAKEINKNMNIAFIIGFLLNFIGLLIYWIYYKTKK